MGIEIEAKFRITDPPGIREKLLAAGAKSLGTVLEENTYFDTPNGTLRLSDCGLRIRTAHALDENKHDQSTLTYKGPRREGELKIRAEEEIVINSPDAARAILSALGYRATVSFQKRRESFRLGNARIELDELPGRGFFLEIEADDEEAVLAARKALGLENAPTITQTYAALVAECLSARAVGDAPVPNKLIF